MFNGPLLDLAAGALLSNGLCAARHIGNRTYRRHGLHFFPWKGAGSGMPWKESSVMDERIRFVIRLKDGESMAALCREFQISRKTGYKIFERYEECGLEGLTDRARRPTAMPTNSPRRLKPPSSPPSARNPIGAPARSGSASFDDCRAKRKSPLAAPSTPSWIAMD